MACTIDIYNGKPYDRENVGTVRIFWSDDRCQYWGWIYSPDGMKIVGDFTADSVRDAEHALGVRFTTMEGRAWEK